MSAQTTKIFYKKSSIICTGIVIQSLHSVISWSNLQRKKEIFFFYSKVRYQISFNKFGITTRNFMWNMLVIISLVFDKLNKLLSFPRSHKNRAEKIVGKSTKLNFYTKIHNIVKDPPFFCSFSYRTNYFKCECYAIRAKYYLLNAYWQFFLCHNA